MYSQNDEEAFILKTFGSFVGRFLDIGAFDNLTFSNTRRLQELGWSGVLVEPDPFNISAIIKNTASDKVKLVFAAVAPVVGLVPIHIELYPERGWATTISVEDLKAGNVRKPCALDCFVPTVSPAVLAQDGPYDFISLDAEWMDFSILRAMPNSMLDYCRLLCIEPRGLEERAEMKAWFNQTGFRVGHETPENLVMVKS